MKMLMPVLFLALLVVGAIASAATEAEGKKKIDLSLDMSIAEVRELKGKPITQVTLDETTVLSYDDIKLLFRDDKLAGELKQLFPGASGCEDLEYLLKTKEEKIIELLGLPEESIEKQKKILVIRSMRSGQAEPETIELTLGMSPKEVAKLKGMPNDASEAKIEIRGTTVYQGRECSPPQGLFLSYEYDDIEIVFLDGKLFSVR